MRCKLCNSHDIKNRDGTVRDNANLEIFECNFCGLVFLSDNNHINNSFYEGSNMHKNLDFDKWTIETKSDDARRFQFLKEMIKNKKVLDFGSGNGGFLQQAKSTCSYVCGVELEKAVIPHYKEKKIPIFQSLNECTDSFDIITSFHVIEHLKDPIDILFQLENLLSKNGKIIIEVPNANDALLTIYKNRAFSHFTYWSCHLYLYTYHSLKLLAKKAKLKIDFIKHIQRYPLSNHLYWLSQNKPGGHEAWGNFIDSTDLNKAYESQLASLAATDTIIASFSKEVK